MSALSQSFNLAGQLLRLSNRRLSLYSRGFSARSVTSKKLFLRHRQQLSRHFRSPVPSISHFIYISQGLHTTSVLHKKSDGSQNQESPPPAGPKPGGNDPHEIFTDMDVLSGVPPPASAIDAVYEDGFLLNNGMRFRGKEGIIIVHNEAFNWITKEAARVHNGVLELDEDLWGILDVVAPKPELLVLGTGARSLPISPRTKGYLHNLGIRIDSMDTTNAASSYNLLATERPGQIIAAALLPASFR
ncbi:hypothetical protein ABW19_dt0208865 [Dactylella cylindrospora]|nr:hypothetical protein ABW19_dt0208865 [Dactylella cylindrospora]